MINKQTAYKMLDEQYNGFWFDFFRKEWFSDKEMQRIMQKKIVNRWIKKGFVKGKEDE